MLSTNVGKFVRGAALAAFTLVLATCAPSSITSPFMRPVPDGPALAARHVGMIEWRQTAPSKPADWPEIRLLQAGAAV
jgi:hypothetical protein